MLERPIVATVRKARNTYVLSGTLKLSKLISLQTVYWATSNACENFDHCMTIHDISLNWFGLSEQGLKGCMGKGLKTNECTSIYSLGSWLTFAWAPCVAVSQHYQRERRSQTGSEWGTNRTAWNLQYWRSTPEVRLKDWFTTTWHNDTMILVGHCLATKVL